MSGDDVGMQVAASYLLILGTPLDRKAITHL